MGRMNTDLEADSESFRNCWENGTLIFMMLMIKYDFLVLPQRWGGATGN
jgi:hypothetical protein